MKIQRPKVVSCPVCGETRFGSGADAVAHVENGFCPGCRGATNAARQIKRYTLQHAPPFVRDRYLVEDGSVGPGDGYVCNFCGRAFAKLSSLMNHKWISTEAGSGSLVTNNSNVGVKRRDMSVSLKATRTPRNHCLGRKSFALQLVHDSL